MKSKRKPLTKIQKHAQGKDCYLVTGVCRQAPENENVCLCHATFSNRGGMRDHDEWAAPGCDRCHDLLDGRMGIAAYNQEVTDAYGHPAAIWLPAIRRWQQELIDVGLMTV